MYFLRNTMKWLDDYRDAERVRKLVDHLHALKIPPLRLMEVCGTHTMAIARYGIRRLMPQTVTLTSGPGCPVCVTAARELDLFIEASRLPEVIITTFGDLLRVPGSHSSLQEEMARGRKVRVVYSPLDALALARRQPDREVIFLGVGFETTAPTVAAAILMAAEQEVKNFSVLSAHKVMPPALTALAAAPEVRLDGLLCPGHVSVIIGAGAYRPLASRFGLPCVIAGFEPVDILASICLLAEQARAGRPTVQIGYPRAVTENGNSRALAVLQQVFVPTDAEWRGFGVIAASGLAIRPAFEQFDACRRFGLSAPPSTEPKGCRCGEVLKGLLEPPDCRLYGSACHPGRPIGPCMVSSEGACAAFHRYEGVL
jgi:hydrogenase expression/formation protein HypD